MREESSLVRRVLVFLLVAATTWGSLCATAAAESGALSHTTGSGLQAAASQPARFPDTIFHNGTIITMEQSQRLAEAIALRDGLIQAVGSDADILALKGPDTEVIDLQGRTLMPGFIDGHTHVLAFPDRMGQSLDEAQTTAIRYGFTTVNEMWADSAFLDRLMRAEREGRLRLRVNVFPCYNDAAPDEDGRKIVVETWFPEHTPILDPGRLLRIPGIKVFVDGAFTRSSGCWALTEPLPADSPPIAEGLCGTALGDLYLSQSELNAVVLQAQNAGYRVAFHAMGDRAIDTALNAIEYALQGQPNALYRHQIEHNSLVRPDQLLRYKALDVLVSVRGNADLSDLQSMLPTFGSVRLPWYVNRYALPGLGIHAYVETDFGWTVDPTNRYDQRGLDPIMHLYGLVTHQYVGEDGSVHQPDPSVPIPAIPIERALQMLTIEPAYAVSMEDYIGSLRPGKYADLVMLSGDPLSVSPGSLKELKVWMTMIGGKVEYCAPGHEAFCPSELPAAAKPEEADAVQALSIGSAAIQEQVLYREGFEDGQAQGWTLDGAWAAFRDTDGNQVLRGSGHHFVTYTGAEWGDYTLSLRVKVIRGGIHINFRTGDCVRYFFRFSETEAGLSKTQPCGTHRELRAIERSHAPGRWYAIKISVQGATIGVYVDGVLVLSFVDASPLLDGGISLETLDDSEFYVDDIMVCR